MARINIEEKWWNDPRRERLSEFLGNANLTETAAVKLWRLSQTYWLKGELIPGHVFIHTFGAKALLQCGLARVYETKKIWVYPEPCETHPNAPQRDPNDIERELNECRTKWASVRELEDLHTYFVYACGSREFHYWSIKGLLQRIEAGKKSAAKRKLANGTAQPMIPAFRPLERNGLPFEVSGNISRTTPNGPEPSSSSSSSSSNSSSNNKKKKKNTLVGIRLDYPPEFDELWIAYGKRGDKKEAWEEYQKLSLQGEELEILKKSIQSYVVGTEFQYRKHFCRFLKTDWREYLTSTPPVAQKPRASFAQQRAENNMAAARAFLDTVGKE